MLQLTEREAQIAGRLAQLKRSSGTHSPSMATMRTLLPELAIRIDACFLSNPHATALFLEHFERDVLRAGRLRDLLEHYPSQNRVLADVLAPHLGVPATSVFVGNGAIEVIQAVLHRFTRRKLVVNIPTFSSYYEFAPSGITVVAHPLRKERNFRLHVEEYLEMIEREQPDTVVLINPNNPDGSYLSKAELTRLLPRLAAVPTVILDESFLDFAVETPAMERVSNADLAARHPNLVLVRSMSKDFGIAGIRAGVGVMAPSRVCELLRTGHLWNSNGLAEHFYRLLVMPEFQHGYAAARVAYLQGREGMFQALADLPGLRVYPSQGNFFLLELTDGSRAADLVAKLLIGHGIYARACNDKLGLEGEFVRLAVKDSAENALMAEALRSILTARPARRTARAATPRRTTGDGGVAFRAEARRRTRPPKKGL